MQPVVSPAACHFPASKRRWQRFAWVRGSHILVRAFSFDASQRVRPALQLDGYSFTAPGQQRGDRLPAPSLGFDFVRIHGFQFCLGEPLNTTQRI